MRECVSNWVGERKEEVEEKEEEEEEQQQQVEEGPRAKTRGQRKEQEGGSGRELRGRRESKT